jgi:hypothetical protein
MHGGIKNTLRLIKKIKPEIKNIRAITQIVTTCDIRAQCKTEQKPTVGLLKPLTIPSKPREELGIDILGPLTKTKGYCYIVLVVDRFTKYIWTRPFKTMPNTSDLFEFLDYIHTKEKAVRAGVSDGGRQMTSKLWNRSKKYQLWIHWLASVHHAQTNGATESQIKNLLQKLRIATFLKKTTWLDELEKSTSALNA